METWQLLGGLTGMLVLYAILVKVFGAPATPIDVVIAIVFGALGLYLGNVLTERLNSRKE